MLAFSVRLLTGARYSISSHGAARMFECGGSTRVGTRGSTCRRASSASAPTLRRPRTCPGSHSQRCGHAHVSGCVSVYFPQHTDSSWLRRQVDDSRVRIKVAPMLSALLKRNIRMLGTPRCARSYLTASE
jgi:hypothetical protein